MVQHLLSSFLLILVINTASAQKKNEKIDSTRIVIVDSINHKVHHDVFVGFDLLNPIISVFKEKKGFSGFLSYQISNKWHIVAEAGYEKNNFNEINWNVNVDGIVGKIGANWFVTNDKQNNSNGVYIGGRIAYAKYNQTVNQYPIRDLLSNNIYSYGKRPKVNIDSFWFEFVLGARIQVFKNFYGELSLHPSTYLGGKKDDDIYPLVIPGYGKTTVRFNLPIFWGLSYKIK